MTPSVTTAPEVHVLTNVTGWSQYRINRLMDAIKSVEDDTLPAPLVDEIETTGWTRELVDKVLEILAGSRAHVQIKAIKFAIENGGVVSREDVYELGVYSESRSLKGFTRPTNRATQTLRDAGDLPEDAEELLEPIYDMNIRGYQRAKGFRIPAEITKLFAA